MTVSHTVAGEFILIKEVFCKVYAIIKTGGKQYKVVEGESIVIEKLDVEEGAKVTGTVEKNGKGPKIRVFKYKSKNNYRRRSGHRQPFTKVKIDKIEA